MNRILSIQDKSLERMYIIYQNAIKEQDIDGIFLYGKRYFDMLRKGEQSSEGVLDQCTEKAI